MKRLILASLALALSACGMPIGAAQRCQNMRTGQQVEARRTTMVDALAYQDANGIEQLITAKNSAEWRCSH